MVPLRMIKRPSERKVVLAPDSLGPTLCIGELLAEIVAVEPGFGFRKPLELIGPFPSGAPAIFIDQCARMGGQTALVGAVGTDDFGHVCLERLRRDGVDVSGIAKVADAPTGTAFVRYRPDGDRDFVFNMWTSAAGHLAWTDAVDAVVARSGHLHVMGTLLANPIVWPLIERAALSIKTRGGSLSFDPNARKELATDTKTRARFEAVLDVTDLLLPSDDELFDAAGTSPSAGERAAVAKLLADGVKEIVVKRGAKGASAFGSDGFEHSHPAFHVVEIDPTGAGDCFGGAYVAARRLGQGAELALAYAAAAGARNVTARGPMEGAGTRAELDAFITGTRLRI